MSTERIDIVVREDGSREVRRNLEDLGSASSGSAGKVDGLRNSLDSLKGLLLTMGIGAGISEIIKYTDEWANLQGRLSLVTNSYREMKQVQTDLFAISQRTRVDLASTIDLYTRISRATKEMNTSDTDRLTVVENINKALIISGASSEEAQRALVQLGQGLSAGTLRGQDLNSVLEQTPRLAQAIAEGMGKTVGDLKKMGEAGTLSAQAVFNALKSQGATLQAEFSQMPQTIAQSFTMLKNEVLKFVGEAGEANGIAGNFAAVLGFLANNLNLVAAAIQAVTVYKLAEFFLSTAAAAIKKYLAIVDSTSALIAERAATIAAAESELALVQAQVAVATATQAAVVAAREEQIARLAQSNANIKAAEGAIAAATAAGVQSFALRTLRIATMELAAAEAARSGALGALATLGAQATRVSAQVATATAAEAAATTALAGARAAATGAAGLATGAMEMLGGPIGIVTGLLTIGVTAWSLWGNKATEVETKVEQTLAEKTQDIIANLDKQIAKLKERNLLAKIDPDLAKADSPAAQQQAAVLGEIEKVKQGQGQYDFSALSADAALTARTAVLQALGQQYANLVEKQGAATTEQEKLNATLNGDKVKQWLDKHQEYLNKTEQLAAAIKEAKKDLGDAFTPEIEKRITDSLSKKDNTHDALLQYKASLDALKQQQKLQQEIAKGNLDHAQAQYDQGGMSQQKFMETQRNDRLAENQRELELVEKQLNLTKGAGKEQVAAREQYIGELAILAQKRLNIEQGYNDAVAGVFIARQRAEMDAANASILSLNVENQGLEDKIKYFNLLPDAITRATIAELENQKAALEGAGDLMDPIKITEITNKIEALKRIAGNQTKSQQQAFDYNEAQKFADAWKQAGDTIGNAMSSAFGKAGQAMGKMVQGYTGLKSQEATLKQQYDDRVKVASGDAKRIKDAEVEYANQSAIAQAGAYADIASAAKGYFNEKTVAYKVLSGIEQAYRLEQIALAAEEMARKIFFTEATTTAKVVGLQTETAATIASVAPALAADAVKGTSAAAVGVATQAQGDPYTAWARMAAMAAVMAGLGFAVSGGHGSNTLAQTRQATQGTGSVLGDAAKQSESISKSIDSLSKNSTLDLKYSAGMLSALKSIDSGINGFAAMLVQTTNVSNPNINLNTNNGLATTLGAGGLTAGGAALGGMAGAGLTAFTAMGAVGGPIGMVIGAAIGYALSKIPLVGKLMTSIFGGKQTLDDSGFTLGSASVGNVMANGVQAKTYADITTSGGWFSGDSHDTQSTNLDASANAQFTQLISSMAKGISLAGQALGNNADEFTAKLNSFVVDIGKVSLKGMTGDQIQKALEGIFSKLGDDMAKYAMPGLDQFQQVGEGYLQTLVRVATGVETANAALANLGITAVKYTDIANKQGDVETEIVRQSLLAAESGNGIVQMLQNFSGTADDLISSYKDLIKVRTLLNNAGANGNNLSSDTLQGAGGLDALSTGADDFFKNFFSDAEQHAAGVANLKTQFDKLGLVMPTSMKGFRDLVQSLGDGTTASNKLQGQVLVLSGTFADLYKSTSDLNTDVLAKAQNDLSDSYNAAYTAITQAQDGVKAFSKTLKDLYDSSKVGDLSPLTPGQKYEESKSQFEKIVAAAKTGDADAQSKFQNAYTTFLNASKAYNMSGSDYQKDFNYAQSSLVDAAAWADNQVDVQQKQLDSLNDLVRGLVDVKTAVLTIPQAIENLAAAITGKTPNDLSKQIDSLYQNILGRDSDAAGKTFYESTIAKGGTLDQVADSLKSSNEYQITQLYQSLLSRTADSDGVAYWANAMNSGTTISQVADAIKSSSEYLTKHGGISYGSMSEVETPPTSMPPQQVPANAISSLQVDTQNLASAVQGLRDDQAAQTDAIINALIASAQASSGETVDAIKTAAQATVQANNSTVSIQ